MQKPRLVITPQQHDAVIFDLDGVVTRTADLHAAAWKQVFDPFLERRAPRQPPFDLHADYLNHVDGKSREDGVRGFLAARGVDLPEGQTGDAPDRDTVRSLASRKDRRFKDLLAREGAQVFDSTLALIRALRGAGIRTAVVSASRNCQAVLDSVGAAALFDAKVDGSDAQREQLAGKPAPDTFVAAARRLGVRPERAVVVEDALAGVQAGRAGGFALVIGVDRGRQAAALRAQGADVVVRDLAQVSVAASPAPPGALDALPEILATIGQRDLAVFLDYDGTLTPIVQRPDLALMPDATRAVLLRLARLCTVAVISGRDLQDVRQRVGVQGICYAGSHGFDILAPAGSGAQAPPQAVASVPDLDRAESLLRERLSTVEGSLLERKRFGLAVHYRMVDPQRAAEVEAAVDAALQGSRRLRKAHGKMVFELLPDIAWHKGAALDSLRTSLRLNHADAVSMYLGDDVTDEDAFRVLSGDDVGIVVMDKPRPTSARYQLADPQAVCDFLAALAAHLQTRETPR